MGLVSSDDGWRVPDWLWERVVGLFVRLLEARLKPGDSSALHSHPDYLVYNLEDGKVKFGGPSGEGEEVELKAGDVMWREAEEHAAEGVGSTDVHALLFELK